MNTASDVSGKPVRSGIFQTKYKSQLSKQDGGVDILNTYERSPYQYAQVYTNSLRLRFSLTAVTLE
jgi:hypothetical protein